MQLGFGNKEVKKSNNGDAKFFEPHKTPDKLWLVSFPSDVIEGRKQHKGALPTAGMKYLQEMRVRDGKKPFQLKDGKEFRTSFRCNEKSLGFCAACKMTHADKKLSKQVDSMGIHAFVWDTNAKGQLVDSAGRVIDGTLGNATGELYIWRINGQKYWDISDAAEENGKTLAGVLIKIKTEDAQFHKVKFIPVDSRRSIFWSDLYSGAEQDFSDFYKEMQEDAYQENRIESLNEFLVQSISAYDVARLVDAPQAYVQLAQQADERATGSAKKVTTAKKTTTMVSDEKAKATAAVAKAKKAATKKTTTKKVATRKTATKKVAKVDPPVETRDEEIERRIAEAREENKDVADDAAEEEEFGGEVETKAPEEETGLPVEEHDPFALLAL